MIDFFEQALPNFWPSALATVIVACASATTWARKQRRAAGLAVVLAVAVAASYAWLLHDQIADPRSNLLARDVAGWLVVGAATPLLSASAGVIVRPHVRHGWAAGTISGLVGAAWVLASPLILLYVHCSSGDCL
jgi:hypothetical protein